MDTVPEFHTEAPQASVSEGLVQGAYTAAREGIEPMTLRTKYLKISAFCLVCVTQRILVTMTL